MCLRQLEGSSAQIKTIGMELCMNVISNVRIRVDWCVEEAIAYAVPKIAAETNSEWSTVAKCCTGLNALHCHHPHLNYRLRYRQHLSPSSLPSTTETAK